MVFSLPEVETNRWALILGGPQQRRQAGELMRTGLCESESQASAEATSFRHLKSSSMKLRLVSCPHCGNDGVEEFAQEVGDDLVTCLIGNGDLDPKDFQ